MSTNSLFWSRLKESDNLGVLNVDPPLQKIIPSSAVVQGSETTSKMEQLSGVMIIIIIGGGVMLFVVLFIFAKRQIMRFTLRSRRGPHVPVGNDAKKVCDSVYKW